MINPTNNPAANPDVVQNNSEEITWNFAPNANWSEMGDTEHFVQFYEADGFLLNSLSGFIGNALKSGDGAIVVASSGFGVPNPSGA